MRHFRRPYVPAAQRHSLGKKAATRLSKESGRPAAPVVIEGRAIAKSFWGCAWCDHLEAFSDYANRLPRGRTYARNGSVIDLHIQPGQVSALVQELANGLVGGLRLLVDLEFLLGTEEATFPRARFGRVGWMVVGHVVGGCCDRLRRGMVPVAPRGPFTIPPPATSQRIGFRLSGHGLSNGAVTFLLSQIAKADSSGMIF